MSAVVVAVAKRRRRRRGSVSVARRRRQANVGTLLRANDARVLGWALQADAVDESELVDRVNTLFRESLPSKMDPANPNDLKRLEQRKRLSRALTSLTGDNPQDVSVRTGVTTSDLERIKGRLYRAPQPPPDPWPIRGFSKGEVYVVCWARVSRDAL